MATVEWDGLTTFIMKMQAMNEKTPEKVGEIMKQIGTEAKNIMDAGTPVRTGELKSHNQLITEDAGFTLMNDSNYALYVEKGTRYMAAQPFLAPAVEEATQQMVEKLPKALEE